MNCRLLTPEEKRKNKLGRLQRNKLARRRKRRARVLESVPSFLQSIVLASGELSSEEGAEFHHAHLARVKTLLRKIQRRSGFLSFDSPELPAVAESEKLEVTRPERRMQKSRRGLLPCWFSAPPLPRPAKGCSHYEALEILMNDRPLRSYCRYRVLEFVQKLLGIELQWAALVVETRLDGGPYKKQEIASFERTVMFRHLFETGRQTYAVVVEQDGLAMARGDWAFFEHAELLDLLPGLHMPQRLCRREYLVNLHTTEGDNPVCLDLHSIDYTPLVRCDVRPVPPLHPHRRRRPREFPDYVRNLEQERREFEALWRSIKSTSSA